MILNRTLTAWCLGCVKHRGTWLFHLWLRGHEYDIEEVRRALLDEVHIVIDLMKKDIAPTGRWTESYHVKYERRARKASGADPDLADFLELMTAKMIRPSALNEATPNLDRLTAQFADAIGTDAERIRPAIGNLIDAFTGTAPFTPESAQALHDTLANSNLAPMLDLLASVPPEEIAKLDDALHGAIDDRQGNSKLVDAIRTATEERFNTVRHIWRATTTASAEMTVRAWRRDATSKVRPLVDFLIPSIKNERLRNRNNPHMAAYTFATYLLHW